MATFALTYRLRLDEPTLVGRPGGDANTVWSHDYLPGSSVRGAVLGRVGFTDTLAKQMLAGDDVRYLNAHLAVSRNGEWRRTLPIPLTWRAPKSGKDMVVQACPGHETKEESKAIRGWFVPCSHPACLVEPTVVLTLHHQRHRGLGRPVRTSPDGRDAGTIYRYASLAPGQHFMGAVVSEDRSALEQIKQRALNGAIRLGKARRGYGTAAIVDAQIVENWREIDSSAQKPAEFMMTLLSPALFRTAAGAPALQPCDEELQHALAQHAAVIDVSASVEQVGGFNRKWSLPVPAVFVRGCCGLHVPRQVHRPRSVP